LINRAGSVTGKTRAEFVLEAARHAAEETLLDRTVLVSPKAYAAFRARLDEPPKANERRRSMRSLAPWL
jgi:uncharacterized protein (DUF1778 family)